MRRHIQTVAPDLLIEANEAVSRNRHKGDHSITLVKTFAHRHTSEELLAVSYRMQALSKLVSSPAAKKWTLTVKGKDYKLLHEALFRAAAKTPLSIDSKQVVGDIAFDSDEFFKIALSESSIGGSA